MAISKNNIITHGLSGKVGDIIVFSQRGGKTIVGNKPDRSHVVQSAKQKQQTLRFQQAVIYAKTSLKDADTKAAYAAHAKEGESAYNVAVADLLHAPEIEKIDLSNYTGSVGDTITVTATDDFQVVEVTVAIYDADGNEIESGNAVQNETDIEWVYTATKANKDASGDKIVVKASDVPGNLTEMDQIVGAEGLKKGNASDGKATATKRQSTAKKTAKK